MTKKREDLFAAGVQYGHKSNQPGSQTFLPPLHSGIELVT